MQLTSLSRSSKIPVEDAAPEPARTGSCTLWRAACRSRGSEPSPVRHVALGFFHICVIPSVCSTAPPLLALTHTRALPGEQAALPCLYRVQPSYQLRSPYCILILWLSWPTAINQPVLFFVSDLLWELPVSFDFRNHFFV